MKQHSTWWTNSFPHQAPYNPVKCSLCGEETGFLQHKFQKSPEFMMFSVLFHYYDNHHYITD